MIFSTMVRLVSGGLLPDRSLNRGSQAALRIDEEVGGRHHGLALDQASDHLHPVVQPSAQLHPTWLVSTALLRDEDVLNVSGVHDRFGRHHQPGRCRQIQKHVSVHAGEQLEPGWARTVSKLQPQPQRAGARVQGRIDELHFSAERLAGVAGGLEACLLSYPDALKVGFIHVRYYPDGRQVRHLEQGHPRRHRHSGDRILRDDVPVDGRANRDRALDLAVSHDGLDLLRGDTEELQTAAGVGHETFQRSGIPMMGQSGGRGRGARPPQRTQQLLLCLQHLGTVDGRQGLAAAHTLSGLRDVKLFDPAGESR